MKKRNGALLDMNQLKYQIYNPIFLNNRYVALPSVKRHVELLRKQERFVNLKFIEKGKEI